MNKLMYYDDVDLHPNKYLKKKKLFLVSSILPIYSHDQQAD